MNKISIFPILTAVLLASCTEQRATVSLPPSTDTSSSSTSTSEDVTLLEEELRGLIEAYLDGASTNFTISSNITIVYQNANYQATSITTGTFVFTSGQVLLSDNLWHSFTMNDVADASSLNVRMTSSEESPVFEDLSNIDLSLFIYNQETNELDYLVEDSSTIPFGQGIIGESVITKVSLGMNQNNRLAYSLWNEASRLFTYEIYDVNTTSIEALNNYIQSGDIPTSNFNLANFIGNHFISLNYSVSTNVTTDKYSTKRDNHGSVVSDTLISSLKSSSNLKVTKDAAYYKSSSYEKLFLNDKTNSKYWTYYRTVSTSEWTSQSSAGIWYDNEKSMLNIINISDAQYEKFLENDYLLINQYSLKSNYQETSEGKTFLETLKDAFCLEDDVPFTFNYLDSLNIQTYSTLAVMAVETKITYTIVESNKTYIIEKNISSIFNNFDSTTIDVDSLLLD